MFLPAPLKGHLCHTARMAEWFLEHPSEYEVHVCCAPDAQDYLPEGVVFHANPESPGLADFEHTFTKTSEGRTAIQALAFMFDNVPMEKSIRGIKYAIAKTKELKPDALIYETVCNLANVLHTACRQWGIPDLQLVAMARPDSAMSPLTLLRGFIVYPRQFKNIIGLLMGAGKELGGAIDGKPLPASDQAFTLFPGAQILCEVPPKEKELYTGPFYPIPPEGPVTPANGTPVTSKRISGQKSSPFSLGLDVAPGLEDWVQGKCATGTPIIYVALGTLATPSADLLKRLVEGLERGAWAIIWALPEAHQALLPHTLSDQFYVNKFLPQVSIFQARIVGCFVSHCGGSSTTEAMCNGIPMVCLPFFGDHHEWAKSIATHIKAGVKLDKFKSTSDDIHQAVEKVLAVDYFRENAEAAASKMAHNAQMRLEFLGSKLEVSSMRVGVPVAVAMILKVMNGENPAEVLPPALRYRKKSSCHCFNA